MAKKAGDVVGRIAKSPAAAAFATYSSFKEPGEPDPRGMSLPMANFVTSEIRKYHDKNRHKVDMTHYDGPDALHNSMPDPRAYKHGRRTIYVGHPEGRYYNKLSLTDR